MQNSTGLPGLTAKNTGVNADLIMKQEELKEGDSESSDDNIGDQERGGRLDARDRPNDSMRQLVQDGGEITPNA
jgi:hypothetical protein